MIRWGSFPKEKGWDGLNDAAINTFNSDVINSFVREMFQNSNDARRKDGNRDLKLKVEFELQKLPVDTIPRFEEFRHLLELIANSNTDHNVFFKHAFSELDAKEIGIFVYRDSNTIGLTGSDDDEKSNFNACVLSEGVSIKTKENSIGSFGIGKNSIYGLSKLRTVIYSSCNVEGERILQGVAKLASHRFEGRTYERKLYLGIGDSLASVRNDELSHLSESAKKFYLRDEPGLTQFALCPNLPENWVDLFIRAILKNYWLLLYKDELEATIKAPGGAIYLLNKGSLEEYMAKYFDPSGYDPDQSDPKGNPYDYFTCYKVSKPILEEIHMLGTVKFYIHELEHKNTNRILYVRNGMVIYSQEVWGFGSIGYCGVVVCESKQGNEYLRMMEPPEHNRFDPARLSEKTDKYTVKDGQKALDLIKKVLRTSLNSILNQYKKQAQEIPWLNELMKSVVGKTGNGFGERTGEQGEIESAYMVQDEIKQKIPLDSRRSNSVIISVRGKELGSGPSDKNSTKTKSGNSTKPGVVVGTQRNSSKASFRCFNTERVADENISKYKLIIHSNDSYSGDIVISQAGDSGNIAIFNLESVSYSTGEKVSFASYKNKAGEIVGFRVKNVNIPAILSLKIQEPFKSSFTISEI
jgi:hypothetical protein